MFGSLRPQLDYRDIVAIEGSSRKDLSVILEAFSKYLHEADPSLTSTEVLARWLWERLNTPPLSNVDSVIHCEISMCRQDTTEDDLDPDELFIFKNNDENHDEDAAYVFRGKSISGDRLLNSLKSYGHSYEQQKWSRWVHKIKASDFDFKTSEPKPSDDKID